MPKRIDLTGNKYGKLTVMSYAGYEKRRAYWNCICECGRTVKVRSESLRSGATRSCNHCGHYEDLTGNQYGRLTALQYAKTSESGHTYWECICECGNKTIVRSDSLKDGNTISCGCYRDECNIEKGKRTKKHGESNTRLYNIWKVVKQRCYNTKGSGYKWYGGKGVVMCDEWKNNFQEFRDWALSHGYDENLTIDRIDSDGNYEPNNCRWITQAENTRRAAIKQKEKRKDNGTIHKLETQ